MTKELLITDNQEKKIGEKELMIQYDETLFEIGSVDPNSNFTNRNIDWG